MTSSSADEVMATRRSPQQQDNTAGKRQAAVYSRAEHVAEPGSRADGGVEHPFPNKPVSHRRPLKPGTQASLELYDLEKIIITKPPKGHNLNGIKQTSHHPREDSPRRPRGELQMAKAIHAKELMLQEKLWRVEDKIRQKIRRDSVNADRRDEEERQHRAERGRAPTKPGLSEQRRREPSRGREMITQERKQEDVKQPSKRPDQRDEDRMRNRRDEGRARGEIRGPQLHRNGCKGSEDVTDDGQEVRGEVNTSRWDTVKMSKGRKGGVDDRGETGVTSHDGWTGEEKHGKKTDSSCKERDAPLMSQQRTSHRAAERKPGETLPPPVCSPSPSGTPEQEELGLRSSSDDAQRLLPCRMCNRKFAGRRLEVHVLICEKQTQRQVFNSYLNRTKGSAIEEFYKTHSRIKTPEVVKRNNTRQKHKANTKITHGSRLPAGASK